MFGVIPHTKIPIVLFYRLSECPHFSGVALFGNTVFLLLISVVFAYLFAAGGSTVHPRRMRRPRRYFLFRFFVCHLCHVLISVIIPYSMKPINLILYPFIQTTPLFGHSVCNPLIRLRPVLAGTEGVVCAEPAPVCILFDVRLNNVCRLQ